MSETISCTRCGHAFAKGNRFCPQCGTAAPMGRDTADQLETAALTSVPVPCSKCKAPLAGSDRFCPKCGTARALTETVVVPAGLGNAQAARLARATEGEFEIVRQLGLGAMGSVYLARDIALSRKVAIKVIASNLLQDESMVSRFRLEAQTVASLRHPNIVNVHAVRESEDLHYFVMDFIDGPPLRSVVKTHAPLEIPVVQALLYQVGSALDYAHHRGKGVVHRDIKPANIMVDREGDAFVTDFGISKITESQGGLTQTGATIGTPEYMSPEQCRGEALTGASDQYALGVVAYEMLVGRTPFTGSQYFIMVAHTSEEPAPILDQRADCPPNVAEAVHRMLAKKPEDRFGDLESALAAMGGGPLGRRDPVRQRITALAGATAQVSALDTASPLSPLPGQAGDDTATSIAVFGVPTRVEEGDSFQLSADVRGETKGSLPGAAVSWSSTEPEVAVVENGAVRALRPGTAVIEATAGDLTHSVSIVVGHAAPAAVVIDPPTVRVAPGSRARLSAEVRDKHGRALERPVRWLTSEASVASVSKEGEVVATGSGSAVVTAESGGVTGTAEVVVDAAVALTGATPSPAEPTITRPPWKRPVVAALLLLLLGAGGTLGARSLGLLGTPVDNGGQPAGPTAAESGGIPAPVEVGDAGPAVAALEVAPVADTLRVGDEVRLIARAVDTDGSTVDAAEIEWVSSDPTLAQVTPDGLLTIVGSGAVTLTAAAGAVEERIALTLAPEVVQAAATAPSPTPAPPQREASRATEVQMVGMPTSMYVGQRVDLSARVIDQRGDVMPDEAARVRWRSEDPTVVRHGEGDVFVAVGPGTATLTAGFDALRAEQTVNVEAVVERIEVRPGTLDLESGSTATIEVRVLGPNDVQLPPRVVRWTSDDEGVIGVDGGRVVARGTGSATVTASAGGRSATVQLSVGQAPATAAVARRLAQEYVGILNTTEEGAITRIYDAASNDRLDDLLDLVDNNDFSARLVETEELGGVPIAFTAGPVRARAEFRLQMTYRTGFGGERIQLRDFRMVIGPAPGGGWRIVSVVMVDD